MADHPVYHFSSEDLARRYAQHCEQRMWVMQDDDGFLVACPAKCAALEREGAQFADPGLPRVFERTKGLAL